MDKPWRLRLFFVGNTISLPIDPKEVETTWRAKCEAWMAAKLAGKEELLTLPARDGRQTVQVHTHFFIGYDIGHWPDDPGRNLLPLYQQFLERAVSSMVEGDEWKGRE